MASGNLNVVLQVVNALLTQMDKLRSSPNVIVLTTSNITAAIGRPRQNTLIYRIHRLFEISPFLLRCSNQISNK